MNLQSDSLDVDDTVYDPLYGWIKKDRQKALDEIMFVHISQAIDEKNKVMRDLGFFVSIDERECHVHSN